MPFKSEKQRRKFYAMAARGEIDKDVVDEWERKTKKKDLPETAKGLYNKTLSDTIDRNSEQETTAMSKSVEILQQMNAKMSVQKALTAAAVASFKAPAPAVSDAEAFMAAQGIKIREQPTFDHKFVKAEYVTPPEPPGREADPGIVCGTCSYMRKGGQKECPVCERSRFYQAPPLWRR